MNDIDTSREAVERLAEQATEVDYLRPSPHAIAATLRALLDERDNARDARTAAIKEMCDMARQAGSWQGIAEGKNVVIRQLEDERDRLRDALRPFAEAADDLDEDHIDNWEIWESPAAMSLTAGNLRKAHAALGEGGSND